MVFFPNPAKFLEHFRVHILIFLLAFIVALSFAHPTILLTDEWVSTNQLAQLYEGHQVILNEGKYGSYENGTPTRYFETKQNYLAYPLLLPIVSLPAEWLVYFFGNHFIVFVVYIWTFLFISLALTVNGFFPQYAQIGKWRWTSVFFIVTFLFFFLNLFYYSSFSLTGKDSYPEIMAIVFTNVIMFALLAVMVYEILRLIFQNLPYAFFGTITCLSCSSYFLWTDFCKDHILVAFLFTSVLMMIIKFLYSENPWDLSGGFFLTGLLAWARPEVGLFIFFAMCGIVLYFDFCIKNMSKQTNTQFLLLLSPLFTLIGAIPFFINNYAFTKNPFTPAFILWLNASRPSPEGMANSSTISQNAPDAVGSILHISQLTTNFQVSTLPSDIYGILFNPQTGSMGILPLVPVFLVAILILPVLLIRQKIMFSQKEKLIIGTLILVSISIFCAYARGISGMNTSLGMFPDIRYLSLIYLPLVIIGLIFVRKVPYLTDKPLDIILWMSIFWIIFIPISLVLTLRCYPYPQGWKNVFPVLNVLSTFFIFLIVLIFVILYYHAEFSNNPPTAAKPLKKSLALICALPFIWQINASLVVLMFASGLGGYSFWIPVIQKIFWLVV